MRYLIIMLLSLAIFEARAQTSQPNIILVLIDDGRSDNYFGKDFFEMPSVTRLRDEGVTFNNAFTVCPLCSPSRSIIQTGLYPHKTGNEYNYSGVVPVAVDTSMFILGPELDAAGYYTGYVGKAFNEWKKPLDGYEYWAGSTAGNSYVDPHFNINGDGGRIPGYFSKIVDSLSMAFLASTDTAEPFFLFVGHKAPHSPLGAENGYRIYDDTEPVLPTNFYKKTDYPSYLYPAMEFEGAISKVETKIQKYYETLIYVDSNMQHIIDYLEAQERLDETMIIYTSDHGFMLGEHKLNGKSLPYEESLRVPLIIRYPAWFDAGSGQDEFALNTDLVPTIFEAAGVNHPDLDGQSLRTLSRDQFLVTFAPNATPGIPGWRALRTAEWKYVEHYCQDTIFELFDLVNDPQENNNLAYAGTQFTAMRHQMDSIRQALNDTAAISPGDCTLGFARKMATPDNTCTYLDLSGRVIGHPDAGMLLIKRCGEVRKLIIFVQ